MTPYYTISDGATIMICDNCGRDYVPLRNGQRNCSSECTRNKARNKTRDANRKEHVMNFVGVDGEGINVVLPDGNTVHRYVMLSVGDTTLYRGGQELTWQDCFEFIWQHHLDNPDSTYVGFYLGYDFTMMLKTLPRERAQYLFYPGLRARVRSGNNSVPFPVRFGEWEFDILGMRRLKIRRKRAKEWVYINDTGSFFQTSFLSVIEPTKAKWPTEAPCTMGEFEQIREGKNKRADTYQEDDNSYYDDMVKYNRLENKVLAEVCRILNQGFVDNGVRLARNQYYGPGQAIQQWLNAQVREHGATLLREDIEPLLSPEVIEAAIASYYGGWFEITRHGHQPGITHEYDIVSAYPHIMRDLPCLCGGVETTGVDNTDRYVLCHAALKGRNRYLGVAPFRNHQGNIIRPNNTVGWYWRHEIDAGTRAGLIDDVVIDSAYRINRCGHRPPLGGLARLFQRRAEVGKATPSGKALKLMLNSCYGKMAQSVGSPKYGNPIYASLITSVCRTMILDAIATHPNGASSVVMVATDGIYFDSPHPTLGLGDRLGQWEYAEKHNLCTMKPGVYWDDKARETNANMLAIKSRGISAKALLGEIARLDKAFDEYANGGPVPTISIPVPFAVTSPKLALTRGKWETAGLVEYDTFREDSAVLEPKRCMPYVDNGIVKSLPAQVPYGVESVAYDRRFGYTDREAEFGYSFEGSVRDAIAEIAKIHE